MIDTVSVDGRRVAVHRLGVPGGRPVVFCHAAPGSGLFDPDPDETERRGVEITATDRPGYGTSEPRAADDWATVSGAADDLAEVLRTQGIGPCGVAGWSAGGRVAMALAARHPTLIERVCVVATPAPNEAVPWIPPDLQAGLDALTGLRAAQVNGILTEQMAGMVPRDPFAPEAAAVVGVDAEGDADVLTRDGVSRRLGAMLESAFAQGATGMAADVAGYTLRPWGFEPTEVQAKTLLLYGARDAFGSRHGRWWQAHLPDARLEMDPGAGHLVVVSLWRRALSFLLAGRPAQA